MSASCLSFDAFKAAAANAATIHVGPNGITVDGIRFNDRKLNRWRGQTVKFFVDRETALLNMLVFTLSGEFICSAWPKRPYEDELNTFVRAMAFKRDALRKLYARGPIGWHGIAWHTHMAAVMMNVLTEPMPEALPWQGCDAELAARNAQLFRP